MSPIALKVKEALFSAKETLGKKLSKRSNIEYNQAVKAWNNKATASEMFDSLVELKKPFAHAVKYQTSVNGSADVIKDNSETVVKIDLALEALKIAIHK